MVLCCRVPVVVGLTWGQPYIRQMPKHLCPLQSGESATGSILACTGDVAVEPRTGLVPSGQGSLGGRCYEGGG